MIHGLVGIAATAFVVAVVLLLLLSMRRARGGGGRGRRRRLPYGPPATGKRGDTRVCPLCAARLEHGEVVRSVAYPQDGAVGRLMHITGCVYCYDGARERHCPVCGAVVARDEYLIARVYKQPDKPHVSVIGCVHCVNSRH